MKLTNNYNIPEFIFEAIKNDPYDAGDSEYTASQLTAPVQITILYKRHHENLSVDVSERIWILLGKSIHAILEWTNPDQRDRMKEERIFTEINGIKISGQLDIYDQKKLYDYKVTGAYSIKDGPKPEWTEQLNILKWLLKRERNIDVNELINIVIVRDWSRTMQQKYPDSYPPIPIQSVVNRIEEDASVETFVKYKINQLEENKKREDHRLHPCTDQDRWLNKKGHYVRCEYYCPVRSVCHQWNQSMM